MIAVDTNVLVRYYINDDPRQHGIARRFFEENDVFVNYVVVVETFWVLTSVYGLSKDDVGRVFDHLKRLSNVQFENETVLARALVAYREQGCDFADAIVGYLNDFHGCETATFDKAAAKKLGFRLL